jgi:hypothetical protein
MMPSLHKEQAVIDSKTGTILVPMQSLQRSAPVPRQTVHGTFPLPFELPPQILQSPTFL